MKILDEINLDYGFNLPPTLWVLGCLSDLQDVEKNPSQEAYRLLVANILANAQEHFDNKNALINELEFGVRTLNDMIDDLKSKIEKLKNERKEFLENAYADLCVEALKHGFK
jgi:predicted RNase H-like nuclease (RuvC/YqgF family)